MMKDEIKKPDEGKEKKPEEKPEEEKPRMVEDANLAAKRLEEANKVMSTNLARQEALVAEAALGGKADAGEEKTEKKEEISDVEYSRRAREGEMNDPL